ncbi:unnamed protein product [Owenia fusiformis]|uniref:Uncharacterized protein n=1 Tax=Owenia fusiformis TaxID=6347 RepID=A0A8J1XWP9_OWEFU|nr:unnamed protein product [Owenia fusiformis]
MEDSDGQRPPPPTIEISTPSPESPQENTCLMDTHDDDINDTSSDVKDTTNEKSTKEPSDIGANTNGVVSRDVDDAQLEIEVNENQPLVKGAVTFENAGEPSPQGQIETQNGLKVTDSPDTIAIAIDESKQDDHHANILEIKEDDTTARPKRPSRVSRTSGGSAKRQPSVVVTSDEKHTPFHNAIPIMPLPLAVLCFILNIVAPGFGTLVSAFSLFCKGTSTRMNKRATAVAWNILTAVLQMATFLVIVGWVWSILWGMNFIQMSVNSKKCSSPKQKVPYYVRRQSSIGYFNDPA